MAYPAPLVRLAYFNCLEAVQVLEIRLLLMGLGSTYTMLHIPHSLLVIQLLLPCYSILYPVATASPSVQIFLLVVFVLCNTACLDLSKL